MTKKRKNKFLKKERYKNEKNSQKYIRKKTNSTFYNSSSSQKKPTDNSIRLNRYIAHAGICSRREADKFIEAGLVTVNSNLVTQMGYRVQDTDIVKFNGRKLKSETKRYVLLNKPRNFSSRLDCYGRKNSVFELIKDSCKEKIFPIGRLNKNTSGLLIFTNDQHLLKKLTHPRNEIKKIYHITLNKQLKSIDLKKIKDGIVVDKSSLLIDSISYVKGEEKTEVGIELKSNKRNIVKTIFETLGYKIIKLDLVFFGGLTKRNIPRKRYRFLTTQEVNLLKRL